MQIIRRANAKRMTTKRPLYQNRIHWFITISNEKRKEMNSDKIHFNNNLLFTVDIPTLEFNQLGFHTHKKIMLIKQW